MNENQKPIVNRNIQNVVIPRSIETKRESKLILKKASKKNLGFGIAIDSRISNIRERELKKRDIVAQLKCEPNQISFGLDNIN